MLLFTCPCHPPCQGLFLFFNIRPYTSIHDPINSMHFHTQAHLHTRTGAYCKDAAPRYDTCRYDTCTKHTTHRHTTHRHKNKQSAKLACIDQVTHVLSKHCWCPVLLHLDNTLLSLDCEPMGGDQIKKTDGYVLCKDCCVFCLLCLS